jgi:large subunit ribosomal protein LP0
MLGKRPFSYGLVCDYLYEDGVVSSANITEIDLSKVMLHFTGGILNIAEISLSIGLPTMASVRHSILNAYKNLLSITLETDYLFQQAQKVKEIVENPEAFQSIQLTTTMTETNQFEKKDEEEPEPIKEESDDMGFSMFNED